MSPSHHYSKMSKVNKLSVKRCRLKVQQLTNRWKFSTTTRKKRRIFLRVIPHCVNSISHFTAVCLCMLRDCHMTNCLLCRFVEIYIRDTWSKWHIRALLSLWLISTAFCAMLKKVLTIDRRQNVKKINLLARNHKTNEQTIHNIRHNFLQCGIFMNLLHFEKSVALYFIVENFLQQG